MVNVSTKGYQRPHRRPHPKAIDTQTHRYIRQVSLVILLLSICLLGWCKLHDPRMLPIHTVKINGNYSHVDKVVLQKTVMPFLKEGFVNLNTENLKKAVKMLPWVDNISVARSWPDKLIINLEEHVPVALWGPQGQASEQGFLDTKGVVFDPGQPAHEALPVLSGPDGQHQFVWQSYEKLNAQLAPLGLKIAQLYLSARQAWILELNNGIKVVLGKVNPEVRLQRLVKAYARVVGSRSSEIDYIDMRYTSGMAIRWK